VEIELTDREGNAICFHNLRNSYISFLANSQTPAKAVHKLARHSDSRLTFNTYSGTFEKAQQKAMNLPLNFKDFVFAAGLAKVNRKQEILADKQRHNNSQEASKSSFLANQRMEAGGFEPPSRDASRQASTCLVVWLFFRLAKRQTTGSQLGYFGEFLPCRPEKPAWPVCCLTPLPNPQTKSGRTGR